MKEKNIAVFLLVVFSVLSLQAADTDSQQWLALTATGKLSENNSLGYFAEVQTRRSNNQEKIYETLLRPALSYKTENWGSYFIGTLKRYNGEGSDLENRHWLQWLNSHVKDDFRYTLRLRLENRDLAGVGTESQRVRLMLRAQYEKLELFNLKPFVATEQFYNLNSATTDLRAGLSQARNFIGASLPVSAKITAELSYLNTNIKNFTRPDQVLHNINLAINLVL